MLKTRLQTRKSLPALSPTATAGGSVLRVVPLQRIPAWQLPWHIYQKEGGLRAFYKGLAPNLIGVIPEKALKLAVNDLVREQFAKHQNTTVEALSMRYGMVPLSLLFTDCSA